MGIYFQDRQMKNILDAYPEMICVDATYKLLELRFPVYIILIEDGNGQSEVVAVFLLQEETEESLTCVLDVFIKHNDEAAKKVRIVMTDKDMTERDVLAKKFPSAQLLICLFHTLRTFRREITMEKMGITAGQRNLYLDLLQQMAYAVSEEKYMEVYERFKVAAVTTVMQYFDLQWHSIRSQWVFGLKHCAGNFFNSTNNRLECINSKLKSVIDRYSSLEDFVHKFFLILRVMRTERDHKAVLSSQKVPVTFHSTDPVSIEYMKYLTPYAYKYISQQLANKSKVKLKSTNLSLDFSDQNQVFEVQTLSGMTVAVSTNSCQCLSWSSMKLPCSHILAVRENVGLQLFDEDLCDRRWHLSFYKSCQRALRTDHNDAGDVDDDGECSIDVNSVVCVPDKKKKVLSQVNSTSVLCVYHQGW